MREQGWEGAQYGSKHKPTIADDSHVRYPDLLDRRFHASAPNRLWVADFVRHEALFDRVEVRDHYLPAVAAAG
jgi:transposase InsO family protein